MYRPEHNLLMTDYTKGGGITAGIVEAVMYFLVLSKNDLTHLEMILISYILGLFGYFAYLAFKKNNESKSITTLKSASWDGNEILAGFFGATMPLIPIVIVGSFIDYSK